MKKLQNCHLQARLSEKAFSKINATKQDQPKPLSELNYEANDLKHQEEELNKAAFLILTKTH